MLFDSWGSLGRPLGSLWGRLRASWQPRGNLFGPLGGLLGLPGPLGPEGSAFGFVFPFLGLSWGSLGALSGHLGGLLGRRGASESRKGEKANIMF